MVYAGKFGILTIGAIVALTSLSSSDIQAQESRQSDNHLKALRDCRTIAEPGERLACFDAEIDTVIAKQDSGEIRIVDKEDIAKTRRGLFGFSMPKTGIFSGGSEDADEILKSSITGLRRLGSDQWEITLEAGSVWRANNTPRRFKPEIGSTVELEEAALGSYWFRVDGKLGVKASRIR